MHRFICTCKVLQKRWRAPLGKRHKMSCKFPQAHSRKRHENGKVDKGREGRVWNGGKRNMAKVCSIGLHRDDGRAACVQDSVNQQNHTVTR